MTTEQRIERRIARKMIQKLTESMDKNHPSYEFCFHLVLDLCEQFELGLVLNDRDDHGEPHLNHFQSGSLTFAKEKE